MNVKELSKEHLSPKGLALVSEFALFLYRLDGTIINVDSKDVLPTIDFHARKNTDPHLRKVYMNLREEMRSNVMTSVPSENIKAVQTLLTKKSKNGKSIGKSI